MTNRLRTSGPLSAKQPQPPGIQAATAILSAQSEDTDSPASVEGVMQALRLKQIEIPRPYFFTVMLNRHLTYCVTAFQQRAGQASEERCCACGPDTGHARASAGS